MEGHGLGHIVRVLKNFRSAEDQLQTKACGSILKRVRVRVRVGVRRLGVGVRGE